MADLKIKISGDSKEAVRELENVREEVVRVSRALGEETEQGFRRAGRAVADFGQVRREVFRELQSEVLEEIINDGSIANTLVRAFHNLRDGAAASRADVARLGTTIGETATATQAASTGARTLGGSLGSLGAGAAVAGVTLGVVAIAAAAAAAAIALTVKGAEEMVETANLIGTKSKDDFDKFKKSVQDAGFTITEMDRTLSQGIIREIETLKAASDGLFIDVIRSSGPQFIQLLRDATATLREMQAVMGPLSGLMTFTFSVGSGALRTFTQLLQLAQQNFAAFLLTVGNLGAVSAIFAENVKAARAEAEKLAGTLPKATFDTKGSKDNEDSIRNQIALLKVQEQAAQRTYNEEIAAARRALDLRAISEEEFTKRAIESERKLLAAKLAAIEAERQLIGRNNDSAQEQLVQRVQLNEQEAQAISDYNAKVTKLRDDQNKADSDALNQTLDNSRKAAEARLKLRQELLQVQLDVRELLLQTANINLERDQAVPGNEAAELERKKQLLIEEARLRSDRAQAEIQFRIDELEFADLTYQEKLELERAFNRELIAERQRLGNELAALAIQARTEELQQQLGIDEGAAAAIAEQEALLERQLTLRERLIVSTQAWAAATKATLPTIAGLFLQTANAIAQGVGNSVRVLASGATSMRQVAKAFYDAATAPIVEYLSNLASKHIAESISHFAALDFAGGARHAAAAAGILAIAAGIGFVGSKIAGGGGGAGAGGLSQQLTGTRDVPQDTEDRVRFRDGQGLARASTQATYININLTTDWAANAEGVQVSNKQSFNNGGTLRKLIQSETQGTPVD